MINHTIHQIWVGNKGMPVEWMQTWKDKHPTWKFMLWDNESVDNEQFFNKGKIKNLIHKLPHGAADIIRYEVLYKYGGFVAPADSVCLLPIDDLMDIEEDCFCCYQHETKRPGLLSPHIGATKGNALMAELIKRIPEKISEPWKETGNKLLTSVVKELNYPIKIYPSHYFIPIYNDGEKQEGIAYADHKWGTTKHLWK